MYFWALETCGQDIKSSAAYILLVEKETGKTSFRSDYFNSHNILARRLYSHCIIPEVLVTNVPCACDSSI